MFTCFRWSNRFGLVGLGPAKPYRPFSANLVYLKQKVITLIYSFLFFGHKETLFFHVLPDVTFVIVDSCISSEPPVFFELRVQYLLSCQRLTEALALAKCCAQHPKTGQHLFFLQVYLTCLYKTSQHERLHKEVSSKEKILWWQQEAEVCMKMYKTCSLLISWLTLVEKMQCTSSAIWSVRKRMSCCSPSAEPFSHSSCAEETCSF